jgi:hypothetical protein
MLHTRSFEYGIHKEKQFAEQTQAKDVTSRDEKYIVVDRSQTTPGLWGQLALSRVKWGGAVSHLHRVGCLPRLASGHSCGFAAETV